MQNVHFGSTTIRQFRQRGDTGIDRGLLLLQLLFFSLEKAILLLESRVLLLQTLQVSRVNLALLSSRPMCACAHTIATAPRSSVCSRMCFLLLGSPKYSGLLTRTTISLIHRRITRPLLFFCLVLVWLRVSCVAVGRIRLGKRTALTPQYSATGRLGKKAGKHNFF